MRIPESVAEQEAFLRWLIDKCTVSKQERQALYERRRRYYLYGQNQEQTVRFNKLKSHLALLRSFVFAEDSCTFSVTAPNNADELLVAKFLAIEDEWNGDFTASGLADAYDEALLWSIVYDTMFLKLGWNSVTHQQFAEIVPAIAIGVFEEYKSFENQQAFVHSYVLDYDDAVERLLTGGLTHRIPELGQATGGGAEQGLPGTMNQLIISATGGTNLAGNVVGEVNPTYTPSPSFRPRIAHTVVPFHEVYVWDSAALDWRTFHVIDPTIIIADSKRTVEAIKHNSKARIVPKYDSAVNFFLKQEHPFVAITPYTLYDYMWGDCHLEDLIPLQDWLNERLQQIDEILEGQVDPPIDFAGFSGLDDERMSAFGSPGSRVSDPIPGAKATPHPPQMPEDLFKELSFISDVLFLEQSGFTEIMAGRGEKNVRGAGHAQQLRTTGAGRVRKVATGLEKSLTRLADKGLKLKAKNDTTKLKTEGSDEFVIAQVLEGDYHIRVAGHSHSPLFTQETDEKAMALFKAQAIDREWLLRLLQPAHLDDLIHALRKRVKAETQQREQNAKQGLAPDGKPLRPSHSARSAA